MSLGVELGPPDTDGWIAWALKFHGSFNDALGQMFFRRGADGGVESRMTTEPRHSNPLGYLHGGFVMSFIDVAMSAIIRPHCSPDDIAVTMSCATDFLGGGIVGAPILASGEVLKETGKLFFVRGIVTQSGENIAAFTGTMRKIARRVPDEPTPAVVTA